MTAGRPRDRRCPRLAALLLVLTTLALPLSAEEPDAAAADAKAALDAFHAEWKEAKDADERKSAVTRLSAVRHPTVYKALATVLGSGEDAAVRRAAAKSLGSYHDRRCAPLLISALERSRKDEEVHVAVLTALGDSEDPAAIEPLGKIARAGASALDKPTFAPTAAAIDALARLRFRPTVEGLFKIGETVESSGKTTGAPDPDKMAARYGLMDRVLAALRDLTGQDFKEGDAFPTFQAYQKWWKENGKKWDPKKRPQGEEGTK